MSLVVGNFNDLRQRIMVGTIIPNSNSSSSSAIIISVVSISILPPLLLLLMFNSGARIGDEMQGKQKRTIYDKTSTKKQDDRGDDKFATIRPLGLRQVEERTISSDDSVIDDDNILPSSKTALLLAKSRHIRTKLAEWLPFGLRYTSDLSLVYSTNIHGRSLSMLYHILKESSSRHTILLLEVLLLPTPSTISQSQSRLVVGMYASQLWHSSPKVYGDGQCFLFRIKVNTGIENDNIDDEKSLQSECWKWSPPPLTPSNTSSYGSSSSTYAVSNNKIALWETFQRSNPNSMSMGINECGVGAGLKLNYDLTKGESHRAVGFDNEPLVKKNETSNTSSSRSSTTTTTSGSDEGGVIFDIGLVEVYQLVREMDGVPIR